MILKWIVIVLISIDFLTDFITKCKRDKLEISQYIGMLIGLALRAIAVYKLIELW